MTTTEMTTTEMTTTDVGEVLVRIDPAENWYASLSRAAAEAEQRGLGLRLVFTAAPQQDPSRVDESRGATTDCGDQSPRKVERCGEEEVRRDGRGNG